MSNSQESKYTYNLSLHDALPICTPRRHYATTRHSRLGPHCGRDRCAGTRRVQLRQGAPLDRKSTRLNSSHSSSSYAVFCLKKKTTDDDELLPFTHLLSVVRCSAV